jgi:hypothetical protein
MKYMDFGSLSRGRGGRMHTFSLLCACRTTVAPYNKKIQPFESNTVYSENYSPSQEVELRKLQKTFRMKNRVFLNITFVSQFLCYQIVERMNKLHTFCDQNVRVKPRRLEWVTVGYYIRYIAEMDLHDVRFH